MAELGKVDLACIGIMVVIILTASGYWAVFAGWAWIDGTPIWMGWVWWVVFVLVIVSLLVIMWASRRSSN